MNEFKCVSDDVELGKDVRLARFVNLYGCSVGDNTKIGTFVEIQKNAFVGKKCKISSHTFICEGVTIGDNCFIGHGVMFINDNFPRAVTGKGEVEKDEDWKARLVKTIVADNVSVGSNATILGGIQIGTNAVIGAGSVVLKDIPPGEIWAGNPARFIRKAGKRNE